MADFSRHLTLRSGKRKRQSRQQLRRQVTFAPPVPEHRNCAAAGNASAWKAVVPAARRKPDAASRVGMFGQHSQSITSGGGWCRAVMLVAKSASECCKQGLCKVSVSTRLQGLLDKFSQLSRQPRSGGIHRRQRFGERCAVLPCCFDAPFPRCKNPLAQFAQQPHHLLPSASALTAGAEIQKTRENLATAILHLTDQPCAGEIAPGGERCALRPAPSGRRAHRQWDTGGFVLRSATARSSKSKERWMPSLASFSPSSLADFQVHHVFQRPGVSPAGLPVRQPQACKSDQ